MFLNFFISAFIALFYSKSRKLTVVFVIGLIMILTIFAGTRTFNVGPDYVMYRNLFLDAVRNPREYFKENLNTELSVFLIPNFLFIFFQNYKDLVNASFFLFSLIAVSIKIKVLQHAEYFFFGVLLYLGNLYLIQEMATIRAGVSSAIFLWAIKDIVNKNDKRFFTKMAFAFLFHYSSILFILVWILNKLELKTRIYIAALASAILLAAAKVNILTLLYLDRIFPKVRIYLDILDAEGGKEVNVFNFRIIIALIFLLLFIAAFKKLKDNRLFVILFRIHFFSIILFFALSPTAMTFSLRTFELLSVIQLILYPMIIKIFDRRFKIFAYLILLSLGIFQIYYLVELTEIFKPYRSWLLN